MYRALKTVATDSKKIVCIILEDVGSRLLKVTLSSIPKTVLSMILTIVAFQDP